MYADELHAMFAYYARRGFPLPPDQPSHVVEPSRWFERLPPVEQARMDDACNSAARNGPESMPWHRSALYDERHRLKDFGDPI